MRILIVLAIIYSTFVVIDSSNESLLYTRFENIKNDQAGGRLSLYEEVIKLQSKATFTELFLGHGHNTVRLYTQGKLSAHNDFLEVLFDYGILVLILYITMTFSLWYKSYKFLKSKSSYAPSFIVSCSIFTLFSLSSHLMLYPTHFIFLTAFWGTILGFEHKKSNIQKYGFSHNTTI
jgi:O-antigen ligase